MYDELHAEIGGLVIAIVPILWGVRRGSGRG